jgi:hypothetical protein
MSYSFHVGGETVWDPARQVGKLFLGQAQAVADVLDVVSGLHPMLNGTCAVDPVVFAAFVATVQAWHLKSRHPELLLLTGGVLTVAVALLSRTGQPVPAGSGEVWEEILAEAALRGRHWA